LALSASPLRSGQDKQANPEDRRLEAYRREGFLGPIRLFTPEQCRRIARHLRRSGLPAPIEWEKGRAASDRVFYDLATQPVLLALLTSLLGEDLILWGASAVVRAPGAMHPWHCDMESAAPAGGFITAWIGLEHTSRDSVLQLISRSHRMGKTVQQARGERGLRRDLATPAAMLAVVREAEPGAALVQPEMSDGDALVFDGRLWHGSLNQRTRGTRTALLFQYATPASAVRMPDFAQLDWPFKFRAAPLPPVIVVAGSSSDGVNRLAPPPPPSSDGHPMVGTAIHPIILPLEHPAREWEAFSAFRGPTRTLGEMSCHASVLVPGHSPHPPHAHREEELLIPLSGEAELVVAERPDDPSPRIERIRPGTFVYYPAFQHHTIRNPGTAALGYLMFKWFAPPAGWPGPMPTTLHRFGDIAAPADAGGFWIERVFEGPTDCLSKLHAHLTVLQPGAGYAPHVDAYDVAILTLEGTVETLGQVVEPRSVIYYSAGERHDMKNVGAGPARYLVFEFHGPGVPPPAWPSSARALARSAFRLGRRLTRAILRRLKRQ